MAQTIPEKQPAPPTPPTNNHNLFIGLLLGFLLGLLAVMFVLGYLPISLSFVMGVFVALFLLVVFLFIGLTWYREALIKKLFGKSVEFDTVVDEAQQTLHSITDEVTDNLLVGVSDANKEKIKTVAPRAINFILWSRVRNWGLQIAITVFVAIGGLMGSILLFQQNKLLEKQNIKIDTQIALEESNRRSALVVMMSNIMDKVDDELRERDKAGEKRILSPQLVGRIAALSQSFKPYRFLEGDTLIEKPYSPERGQLLLALANSGIDTLGLDILYRKTTFKRAYLKGASMKNLYLKGVELFDANLNHAQLDTTNLQRADLRGAKLHKVHLRVADIRAARFEHANLFGANLREANARSARFESADLSNAFCVVASFQSAHFDYADLRNADFSHSTLSYLDFEGSDLYGVDFSYSKFINVGIEYNQLESLENVYMLKGLPDSLTERLFSEHPLLFTDPYDVTIPVVETE